MSDILWLLWLVKHSEFEWINDNVLHNYFATYNIFNNIYYIPPPKHLHKLEYASFIVISLHCHKHSLPESQLFLHINLASLGSCFFCYCLLLSHSAHPNHHSSVTERETFSILLQERTYHMWNLTFLCHVLDFI